MGIFCEIGIYKPEEGSFQPGDVVAGIIKYGFDKDTKFSEIIVSFKGVGEVHIKETSGTGKNRNVRNTYKYSEMYVDLNYVIMNNNVGENIIFNKGMYEVKFSFRLPADIPSSLDFRYGGSDSIICFIKYYIQIKFDRPGFFQSAKRYKQAITVLSNVRPTLPMEPTICGEKKVLSKIFSFKERVVNLKAIIENCVISSGGKIKFNCEVSNFTDITVKAIKPQLMEVYTFMNPKNKFGCKIVEEIVKDTSSKSGAIKSGNTQNFEFEIIVPTNKLSIENSNIVSRKYNVVIEAILPVPHRNVVLKIPIQIGKIIRDDGSICEVFENNFDTPPTYWEAMAELKEGDYGKHDINGAK